MIDPVLEPDESRMGTRASQQRTNYAIGHSRGRRRRQHQPDPAPCQQAGGPRDRRRLGRGCGGGRDSASHSVRAPVSMRSSCRRRARLRPRAAASAMPPGQGWGRTGRAVSRSHPLAAHWRVSSRRLGPHITPHSRSFFDGIEPAAVWVLARASTPALCGPCALNLRPGGWRDWLRDFEAVGHNGEMRPVLS